MVPIKCRECKTSRLPHDEHCTPEDLKDLRRIRRLFTDRADQEYAEAEIIVRLKDEGAA